MQPLNPSIRFNPFSNDIAKAMLLFAAYFFTARFGLGIGAVSGFATLIWPPSGIALAALLLGGIRLWPAVFFGALIANLHIGANSQTAIAIGIGNTLESVVAAAILQKLDFRLRLERVRDFLSLIAVGALLSTMLSASIGVTSLWLNGTVSDIDFSRTWQAWWLGDAISIGLLTPLILAWRTGHIETGLGFKKLLIRALEIIALIATTAFVCVAITEMSMIRGLFQDALLPYALFPCLIWASISFGLRGSLTLTLFIAVIAIFASVNGQGPFVQASISQKLFSLQLFIGCTTVTNGVLSCALTERTNAAFRSRRIGDRLELTQRAAQLASWEWNMTTGEVLWSGSVEEVYGAVYPTYKHWYDRLHPDDRQNVIQAIERAVKTGVPYLADYRFQWPNGEYRWLSARGKILTNRKGLPLYPMVMVGVNIDISQRKRIEAELIQAKESAESANRAKSSFIANMSHEIRTPLGVVLGFSELLTYEELSPDVRAKYTEAILRNGKLLSDIINDILDLSKIEAGKLEIQNQSVVTVELLDEVLAPMKLQAATKNIELRCIVDDCVPKTITTDPLRVRQILLNLVGNAVKFTQKGRIHIFVGTEVNGAGSRLLRIEIQDTGPGIDVAHQSKLFEPFTQVDSSLTRKHGGTGLGLALSRRLARALGGDLILVESTPGRGTTFVTLFAIDDASSKTFFASEITEGRSIPAEPLNS